MAHGLQSVLKQRTTSHQATKTAGDNNNNNKSANGGKTGIGSRRIFPPHFKLQVLDSYRNDSDCKGNQRATARKYGIHRRQIQKWLQAEANLRNSVNNGKGGINTSSNAAVGAMIGGGCDLSLSCRLRDDSAPDAYYHSSDQAPRVPCIGQPDAYEPCCGSPQASVHAAAALDYSSSSSDSSLCDMPLSTPPSTLLLSPSLSPSQYNHNSPSPILEHHPYVIPYQAPNQYLPHEPIDLSMKQLRRADSPFVDVVAGPPVAPPLYTSREEDTSVRMPDPEVWDLTVRKRSYKEEPQQQLEIEPPAKRPFKLFKPYLDDNQDSDEEQTVKPELPISTPPLVNNNNTYCTDYPSCCAQSPQSSSYYQHYQAMPYDSWHDTCLSYLPSPAMSVPLKQRQSYSVDFKLRAIESYYYGEECCRGNQRAVANKYNVHRRQVQKWLRQEDELRTRNVGVTDAAINVA